MAILNSYDVIVILNCGEPHLASEGMFARSPGEAETRVWNAFETFVEMTKDMSVHPKTFRIIRAEQGLATLIEY